jgi:hypothetical protein
MPPDADVGTPSPGWLIPKPARPLTGQERFSSDPSSVLDFWRWAFSDLRTNIVRGVLAEYLVARAVGDPSPLRKAWDNWDVTTATGIKVEVKSSAYLQSWNQRKLSAITFSGLTGQEWSAETNELAADRTLRAEVYVFAGPHMQRARPVRPTEDRGLGVPCDERRAARRARLSQRDARLSRPARADRISP